MFVCPPKCSFDKTEVYGDGLYHLKSSLCRAGIHANIITDDGGSATFTVTNPIDVTNIYLNNLKDYLQSTKAGVTSLKFDNRNPVNP
jgi:hypothetical protein